MTNNDAIKRLIIIKSLWERELSKMPLHEPLQLDIQAIEIAIKALRKKRK